MKSYSLHKDLFNFPFLISGVTFFVREKDTGA